MKNYISYLIVFTSLFFPKIYNLDISVVFILIWFLLYQQKIYIDNFIKLSILSFFIVFVIASFNYFFYLEIFGLLRIINIATVFFFTYAFLKSNDSIETFKIIIIVFILSLTVILLEYLNIHNSKDIIRSFNNIFYITKDVGYRARGLYPGYASAGLMMGISSIILFIYAYTQKNKYLYYFAFFSLSSTVITSRTGFLVGFIGLSMSIMYILFTTFSLQKIFKFSAAFILLIMIIINLSNMVLDDDILKITLHRFFEIYDNYHTSGSLSSNSTDELFSSYYLPEDIYTQLFGRNVQPWVSGGVSSDVGFVQSWHQFGLFGMLILYFPFLMLVLQKFYIIIKKKRLYFLIYISLLFDMLIIITNFKGNYIYAKGIIFITLFLHFFSISNFKGKDIR